MTEKIEHIATNDGFQNLAAHIGLGAGNTLSKAEYVADHMTNNIMQLEAMYRSSWLVGAAVDQIAEDMVRAGIDISTLSPEREEEMQSYLSYNRIWTDIEECIKWSRLYGGALLTIVIDGQDTETPLKYDAIDKGQFIGLKVYDRWQVNPSVNDIVQYGPSAGQPKYYRILADMANGETGAVYHHSRIVKFVGIRLPHRQEIAESYWGESILERINDRLVAFDSATMGSANLLERAYNRMIGINGLREILAMGGKAEQNLISMFDIMARLQTNEGITLLDKDDEFQTQSYTFSGIPETLQHFGEQISGAVGIPLVRLFGQSPAGLNSTGESDIRMYYDNIRTRQESTLRCGLHSILRVIHNSIYGEDVPPGFNFTFNPLKQDDTSERVSNASSIAQMLATAYNDGLISLDTAVDELKQSSQKTGFFKNAKMDDLKDEIPDAPEPDENMSDVNGTQA